jgi:hypothetical protein
MWRETVNDFLKVFFFDLLYRMAAKSRKDGRGNTGAICVA